MSTYIYENHLGGYYASDEQLDYDSLYCEQCGDSDWCCGWYDTFKQFLEERADDIDCNDGWGGYSLESIIEDISYAFDDKLTYDEAKEIVLANRTNYDDEYIFYVKFKNSLTNKEYIVYNIRDDKTGYPQFLIYDNCMWVYRSAKFVVPMEDDE